MVNQPVSLFFAFLAGLASFFSPCILPLVPAYISFITGRSIQELTDQENKSFISHKVLTDTLLFIAGFSVVFILLGGSATFMGSFLLAHQKIIKIIGGLLVIILGLQVAGVFHLPFLQYEKRISLNSKPVSFIGSFIAGVVFSAAWTPCVGPILASILVYAGTQETIGQGMALLSVYSLGLGLPFLLAGLAINLFLNLFQKIKRHIRLISFISGIILVIMGILIMTDNFHFIVF
jgi:cytochrome c-type biogenesis protein